MSEQRDDRAAQGEAPVAGAAAGDPAADDAGRLRRLCDAIDADDDAAVEQQLAESPALIGARSEDGVSLVLRAQYRRRPRALAALLAAAGPLDLFEAAAVGRLERVEELLAADPTAVSARSDDGFTALHLACFFHHPATAAVLVEAGADVGALAENPMRVAPLHSAAAVHAHEIAALLLDRGADPNAAQIGGFTALHSAAHSGDLQMADLLLLHGADREKRTDDGRSALDFARDAGHLELAARLAST